MPKVLIDISDEQLLKGFAMYHKKNRAEAKKECKGYDEKK